MPENRLMNVGTDRAQVFACLQSFMEKKQSENNLHAWRQIRDISIHNTRQKKEKHFSRKLISLNSPRKFIISSREHQSTFSGVQAKESRSERPSKNFSYNHLKPKHLIQKANITPKDNWTADQQFEDQVLKRLTQLEHKLNALKETRQVADSRSLARVKSDPAFDTQQNSTPQPTEFMHHKRCPISKVCQPQKQTTLSNLIHNGADKFIYQPVMNRAIQKVPMKLTDVREAEIQPPELRQQRQSLITSFSQLQQEHQSGNEQYRGSQQSNLRKHQQESPFFKRNCGIEELTAENSNRSFLSSEKIKQLRRIVYHPLQGYCELVPIDLYELKSYRAGYGSS